MLQYIHPLFLLLFSLYFSSYLMIGTTPCQAETNPMIRQLNNDSVFVQKVSATWQMFHRVRKGQTLYTLHKTYLIPIEYLKKSNQLQSDALSIGDQIQIPLYKHKLRFLGQPMDSASKQIPVYYRVHAGETLFSLATKTFHTTMQAIRQTNHLKLDKLSPGQVLMVGWCEIKQNTVKEEAKLPLIYEAESNKNQQLYWQAKKLKSSQHVNGVAYWDRTMKLPSSNQLLALFKADLSCKYIRISNPLTRRTVYVKSISNVPLNAKTKGCEVQITPSVADALGAIDSRFYVEIEYIY